MNSLRVAFALMRGELGDAERLLSRADSLMDHATSSIASNVNATQFSYIRRDRGHLDELKPFVLGMVDETRIGGKMLANRF